MTPEPAPEPAPINHALAETVARDLIQSYLRPDCGYDYESCIVDAFTVSRAYLARSAELEELQKAYDAAREEIMDLERRAVDDAKHLEATSARATENYNALAAENARLREALLKIESECGAALRMSSGSGESTNMIILRMQNDLNHICFMAHSARGGA